MTFKVVVKNADGSFEWELPYDNFTYTEELNKDRSATFSFNYVTIQPIAEAYGITVENIFSASYREIFVYDEDDNLIYGGFISELGFSGGENDRGKITVSSKGFFSLLEKRYTDNFEEYTSEDSGDIAWDLINTTQTLTNGNFGITRGAHPTTKDRDRTLRFENIGDIIRKMSANEVKDGYDFEVDNSKVFNIYYPEKGTKREGIVLSRDFNILTYNIIKTFIDGMANKVYVIGEGQGDDTVYVERSSESVYPETFFLLEEAIAEKDVNQTSTLNDKGDAYLNAYKYPRYSLSLTTHYEEPSVPTYNIGDRLKIEIEDYAINKYYRLIKRTVKSDGTVYLSFDEI